MLIANDKTQGERRMATPNYSYEKRQRELAKKRKQEEKRQKKQTRNEDGSTQPDAGNQAGDTAPASTGGRSVG